MDQFDNRLMKNGILHKNIKEIVIGTIQSLNNKLSYYIDDFKLAEAIEVYLKNKHEKYLTLDTLAFPNRQTRLDVLYEPLTLVSEQFPANAFKDLKIDNEIDLTDFLSKYRQILVEDTAGMGKSTLSKKIFNLYIEKILGIPILIELRHINEDNSIITEICRQFSHNRYEISADVVLGLIGQGNLLILLDGYDEIANVDRSFVVKDLLHFIEISYENYFIFTSRPESSLSSFGRFFKFNIAPLEEQEAYNLLKRYDTYSYKPVADLLISKISDDNEISVKEFLQNPLLVSLLYKAFDYKKDIPVKKTQFYRQIFEALFEQHDYSKEGYYKRQKHSMLHLDDFERVLRYVGYFTAIQNKVEYETNYILEIVNKVKSYLTDLNFKASDFIKDLLETVPLFKKEGNYIKWAHKSLQDYFAAKFIWLDAKYEQESILKKIYSNLKGELFSNIIDLFHELDPQTFECTILYWELKDFEEYALKHIDLLSNIPIDLRKKRISNLFQYGDVQILVTSEDDYDKFTNADYETDFKNSLEVKYKKMVFDLSVHNAKFFHYFSDPKIGIITYCDLSESNYLLRMVLKRMYPNLVGARLHIPRKNKLIILEEKNVYTVDYSEDNILNSQELFVLTNDLTSFTYNLNYDEALNKLKYIEKMRDKDFTTGFLNW